MANDRLVYCRVCGAQIAKSAKKCPNCGAKQKKSHAFRNIILFLIIIGIAYAVYTHRDSIGSMNSGRGNKNQTAVKERSLTEKQSESSAAAVTSSDSEVTSSGADRLEGTSETQTVNDSQTTQETAREAAQETTSSEQSAHTDTGSGTSETDANGVTVSFKEYMDSYEAFMNEYCDFMASYDESDLTALAKYTSLMAKYAEYASKVAGYNEDDLSAADYKYFIDVMARVDKKLVDTGVSVNGQ